MPIRWRLLREAGVSVVARRRLVVCVGHGQLRRPHCFAAPVVGMSRHRPSALRAAWTGAVRADRGTATDERLGDATNDNCSAKQEEK